MEQEILPCRICGAEEIVENLARIDYWVVSVWGHGIKGSTMPTREEALTEWNKMMATEVSAAVERLIP